MPFRFVFFSQSHVIKSLFTVLSCFFLAFSALAVETDVGVISIDSHTVNPGSYGVDEKLTVTIENFGDAGINRQGIELKIFVNGTLTLSEFVDEHTCCGSTLAAGLTYQYTLVQGLDLSVPGTYQIDVFTDYIDDVFLDNDSASTTIITENPFPQSHINALPYSEDFESGAGGWESYVPIGSGLFDDWELGTPDGVIIIGAASGTNAWATNLDDTYAHDTYSFVVSPTFNTVNRPFMELSMSVWWESPLNGAGAAVQISNDDGVSWNTIGSEGEPDNWYSSNQIEGFNDFDPTAHGWAGYDTAGTLTLTELPGEPYLSSGGTLTPIYNMGSGSWVTARHTVSGGSDDTRLRVVFGSDFGDDDGFAFDDITLVPAVSATHADSLVIDVDTDGNVDPGDTVRFTTVISNTSTSTDLTNLVYTDGLSDANLQIVVGSVTTSLGTITLGNTGGDTTVEVGIPAVGPGAAATTVTITFDAIVGSLSGGATQICSQSKVQADEFGGVDLLTDDPDVVSPDNSDSDITCSPATVDADNDGVNDSVDKCAGFDDALDADSDGVPDGCDICAGSDDALDADTDGTPDGCENCPNDANKLEPGVCGCGSVDVDRNSNGTMDCVDPVVNLTDSGNCVAGERDCVYRPLSASSCVVANGFLEHINITSVVNQTTNPLEVNVEYYNAGGALVDEVTEIVEPQLKQDFIINDLGLEPSTVGTVCVNTDGGFGSWTGSNVIYRPTAESAAFGDGFEYALNYPFENAFESPVSVPLNTFRLGADPQSTVANWISIADAVIDGNQLTGRLFYFDQFGQAVGDANGQIVRISDGGRIDFPGHEGLTGGTSQEAVGMARFIPDNLPGGGAIPFYITMTRYFYNCPGASCASFLTAFSLPNRPGTSDTTFGGVSTIGGETSIIELNNFTDIDSMVDVKIFDSEGEEADTFVADVPANSTRHYVVNGRLDENAVGTASATLLAGTVSASTIFYRLNEANVLEYAYATPFAGTPGASQVGQFNSFISHVNPLEISNTSGAIVTVEIKHFDSLGNELWASTIPVDGNATVRFVPELPVNRFGTTIVTSSSDSIVLRSYIVREEQYVLPVSGQ